MHTRVIALFSLILSQEIGGCACKQYAALLTAFLVAGEQLTVELAEVFVFNLRVQPHLHSSDYL